VGEYRRCGGQVVPGFRSVTALFTGMRKFQWSHFYAEVGKRWFLLCYSSVV